MWLRTLPLAFVPFAAIYTYVYFAQGELLMAKACFALAIGLGLWGVGSGAKKQPLQWFGAGIAAFALVVLLWAAVLR